MSDQTLEATQEKILKYFGYSLSKEELESKGELYLNLVTHLKVFSKWEAKLGLIEPAPVSRLLKADGMLHG